MNMFEVNLDVPVTVSSVVGFGIFPGFWFSPDDVYFPACGDAVGGVEGEGVVGKAQLEPRHLDQNCSTATCEIEYRDPVIQQN